MERPRLTWRIGPETALACGDRTLVMGVVNVTPDSFSDGGRYLDPEAAVAHGVALAPWADILDVGGESTRPGSDPVPVEEELHRVVPVVKRLAAETDLPISIDTRKPEVAAAALDVGARIVNDVTAGSDPQMVTVVRHAGAGMVLMHMHGEPKTMQRDPLDEDAVSIVKDVLVRRLEAVVAAGVDPEQLAVDPGLGFGKTTNGSLRLMREMDAFLGLGRPLVVGPSRKSFIGNVLGDPPPDQRLEGTVGAACYLASRGAHVVRVHDAREVSLALRVVDAITGS